MKRAGMLKRTTDTEQLSAQAFVQLEGVTDEWLETLPIEKVANGQVTRKWLLAMYAKLDPKDVLCAPCLVDGKL
jgi:NitT/TauT family transport system substrate-binding protein